MPIVPRSRCIWPAALAGVFALLVWKLEWSCDDSFISLRYARNLARGAGLVYNPGEEPRVEGYSNLLWVLYLAPFEALGARAPLAASWSSAACGAAVILLLGRLLVSHSSGRPAVVACALLFAATLPPLAAWSTSGMETMPFTLALFGTFAALHGARPRAALAGVAACAAVLLRADGALLVGLVLGSSLGGAALRRNRPLARAVLVCGAAALAVAAAHVLWRHSYYGAWGPNTARAKVELSATVAERGFDYVLSFLLSYPAVALALLVSGALLRKPLDALALSCAAIAAGVFAYALLLGGDFMAMGRFLVPSLPFLALLFARALDRIAPGSQVPAVVLGLSCAALSVPGAFGVDLVPDTARRRFDFRWSAEEFRSEHERWKEMRGNVARWSALGRALKAHTEPGESLILGTVGAVGYYSDLVLFDPFGLVSREEFAPLPADARRSPGHQRRVPIETFLRKSPTYLNAALTPADRPFSQLPGELGPGGWLRPLARFEWLPLDDLPGVPSGTVLRLVRYVPSPR